MKKIKINKYLCLTIILTILGFAVLFFVNNIYPFGKDQMSLIDFDSGYIPAYYKLWDVLHLKSTLFWDWNLGSGLNALGSLIGNGFISPLCWIIGLFPRSSIPYTISYVYLAKMILVSIISYYAISKVLPSTKEKYKVLFSLMYTFSSWTFMMSTNLLYLDAFAIFPLLVYSLKELLEKGHWKLYTLLLTLTLMTSYYIAWLDLFFIIGTTGLYLLIMKPENRKEKAVKVLVCTLLSLLFSCVLFLPGFMFAKTSTRMANNTSNDGIFAYFFEKSLYLFTLAIPFVLTIKQLFIKKDKKLNVFIISMLVFLLLGVFIEPTNALWHTGSHSGFPFRYAYQPTFFMILVGAYYLNKNHEYSKNTSKFNIIFPIIGLIYVVVFFFCVLTRLSVLQYATGLFGTDSYLILLFFFISLFVIYIISIANKEKVVFILTIMVFLVSSGIYGFLYEKFLGNSTSLQAQKIATDFNLRKDGYNYMSNLNDMNINYPYILKVPSIANRIHFIRQEFADEIKYLGYQSSDTIIYSNLGNMFNNLLLQNKYFLSSSLMNNKYYKLLEEHDGIYYYQAKYNLNYILPYNGKEYNEKNDDMFDNSNQIYKTLFDGENEIYIKKEFEVKDGISFEVKKGKIYELKFDQNGDINLSSDIKNFVEANENIEYVRTYTAEKYSLLSFSSKIDATVNLKTNCQKENIHIYEFNEDEFIKFVNNNQNNVKVKIQGIRKIYTYEALESTAVLLPINYDDNYIIKVNGKQVDYKLNLYNMLSINVKKGTNKIEVVYNQKWLKLGTKISIISLAMFLVLYLINKKFRFINKKIIVWPLFIIACLFFVILIGKVYLLFWL